MCILKYAVYLYKLPIYLYIIYYIFRPYNIDIHMSRVNGFSILLTSPFWLSSVLSFHEATVFAVHFPHQMVSASCLEKNQKLPL